jgi:hypothetical protein
MAKRKRGEPVREFYCETCKQEKCMNLEELKEHLVNLHGIDIGKVKGTREMTMHMDGSKFYQSNYLWTFGEVKVTEVVSATRVGEDRKMWA